MKFQQFLVFLATFQSVTLVNCYELNLQSKVVEDGKQ